MCVCVVYRSLLTPSLMSSTFFLSPPPPLLPHLINTSNSHYTSVSITDLHIPKSISLRIPKPIDRSEWLKLYSTSSSVSIATVGNGDGNENRDTENEPEPTKPVHSFSPEPSKGYSSAIKMRTAPWMKGPFLLEPNQVVDLSKSRKTKDYADGKHRHRPDSSLTEKVSGGRGNKAMKKIFISIDKLQEKQKPEETQKAPGKIELDFSMAESPEVEEESKSGGKMPWERKERIVIPRLKKEKVVNVAELGLDRELLERLRSEASRMRKWVKVKKAGVTQAVVDQIHLIWKDSELAMINFDFPLCQSMARAREIVEMKTGGLVVWRKKDFLVVYRGCNYRRPFKTSWKKHDSLDRKISTKEDSEEESSAINASLYEREADRLLDGLGPRFVDWWRPKPLPVDADLLPEVVPGFKPPFRLCPPRARPKLTDYELTYLRNLSHPLPTHFVLGRNRKLQGLAAAILKLWEKCHIAKIAVKLGVPNTSNEQMANELKSLTGGVLLLRNKFLILLYRGKDFLPHSVANSVADRETELMKYQLEEEAARRKAAEKTFYLMDESLSNTSSTIGTLSEFEDILSERGNLNKGNSEAEVPLEAEKARLEKQLRNHERQLFILNKKIERSAKQLEKLNSAWRPAEHDEDQEMITDEEKECLRKIGLKMDSSLVLGRRGVFGGVIEGLHQHWKHREVVKVITMQRRFSQVVFTAKRLEVESGGILVSVDKQKEGHAIIIYRGKNYRRPLNLPARNLLTKREALFRSLEMQRVGSLKFFAYQRQKQISELKNKLAELESTRIEQ